MQVANEHSAQTEEYRAVSAVWPRRYPWDEDRSSGTGDVGFGSGVGSAPVRADDNDGDLGRDRVRVLTQNMYVGASLGILLGAKSLTDLITTAIPKFSQNILATKPDERAAAMAAEIAKQRPDFVALNEVWILTTRDFKMDLLQSVLKLSKHSASPMTWSPAEP